MMQADSDFADSFAQLAMNRKRNPPQCADGHEASHVYQCSVCHKSYCVYCLMYRDEGDICYHCAAQQRVTEAA